VVVPVAVDTGGVPPERAVEAPVVAELARAGLGAAGTPGEPGKP
jgi:hypothetical protein